MNFTEAAMMNDEEAMNASENDQGRPVGAKTADNLSLRERVLYEAASLTSGDRNKTYGDPTENHHNIASLWNAYWNIRCVHRHVSMVMDAEDVELMMVLLKVARAAQRKSERNSRDTFVDMCAYAAMALEARKERVMRRHHNGDSNEEWQDGE